MIVDRLIVGNPVDALTSRFSAGTSMDEPQGNLEQQLFGHRNGYTVNCCIRITRPIMRSISAFNPVDEMSSQAMTTASALLDLNPKGNLGQQSRDASRTH